MRTASLTNTSKPQHMWRDEGGRVWRGALRVAFTAVLGAALLVPSMARSEESEEVVPLDRAAREVEILEDVLRSSSAVNDEILGALDAVQAALENLTPPPSRVIESIPAEASEDARAAIERENDRHEREWKKHLRAYKRAVDRLRDDAEDVLLRALREVKADDGQNTREPVNIAAARILSTWPDRGIARRLQRVIERHLLDAKHEVSPVLLEEALSTLARIGHVDSLEWLIDEFSHTRSTPQEYVDQLVAAHQAMLRFPYERTPGALRHEIVEQMIRSYGPVESQAGQNSTDPALVRARLFWARISHGVLEVLQRYAGQPKDARGAQFGTVASFQEWFRDHKSPRDDVWRDAGES